MLLPSRGQKSEGGADTDRIKHAEGVVSLSGSPECHEQPGHLLSVSTIRLAATTAIAGHQVISRSEIMLHFSAKFVA